MNNVSLMGRLTQNPELKTTQNGTRVTSFSLAVDRKYTPKGQERKTDFITCVAWRVSAEFISKWFRKGDMIGITGEIQTRNYEDKNGNKRTAVEVVIDNAYFCGKKNESQQTEQPTFSNNSDYNEIDYGDDDLQF